MPKCVRHKSGQNRRGSWVMLPRNHQTPLVCSEDYMPRRQQRRVEELGPIAMLLTLRYAVNRAIDQ